MTDYDINIPSTESLFSVKGKIAVITGGSRGLGLSAASALLQAGAAKVYVSSRKKEACEVAAAALNGLSGLQPGARAISVPADVATMDGVRTLLAAVQADSPDGIDILLANAGATWGAALEQHSDAAIAKVLDLNVRAVFNTVREFAPLLAARGSVESPSRILVTGSVAGLGLGSLGPQATFGYSASKAAVIHLARNLAVDLGPRHVTVNALAPGFFPTKMSQGLLDMAPGGADAVARSNPMRRLGRPADFGAAVVYLCAPAGSHVNGATLAIDGGAMWAKGELLSVHWSKL
ncbi:short chain dehydrogenase reductase [Grosmannia clavigera kw1407]|uniref:Short chain dehydrogenase reductase n=1 Tax=Grosmannia clavigera (strain kw1407 / UAMH 11150) TaxID=655863 RepID=F0XLZ7_GROCL|nr:short chain dehydrogenase reductase [Grosmannia clavigera kw1407]EFX01303.1 short chain dehydrogenase reductase [Grosmannia clavigera kw1407]